MSVYGRMINIHDVMNYPVPKEFPCQKLEEMLEQLLGSHVCEILRRNNQDQTEALRRRLKEEEGSQDDILLKPKQGITQ